MRFGSLCSGIEAASAGWVPLGWEPVFLSEIDPFPCAVLSQRHPGVPNLGDMTRFKEWPDAALDVLVGGTPCQSYSVAGLRGGLDDARGNLTLTYAAVARRYRPGRLVWENVPGVLSSNGGRDFASLLGLLSGRAVVAPAGGWQNSGTVPGIESAYGLAWRVLDAQYFGVPQRRRRVFVVGYLGDWRRAAAVLFERASLRGDPAPRRKAGERVAPTVEARANAGGAGWGTDFLAGGGMAAEVIAPAVANPLTARMHKGVNTTMDEGQTMIATAFKASHFTRGKDGAPSHVVPPLSADADKGDQDTLVFDTTQITSKDNYSNPKAGDPCHPLASGAHPPAVAARMQVRRLTPRECERLQGFPDDYTLITVRGKPAADGPRYKALGNSMAVPVMRWLGERMQMVEMI